ncbi:TraB/VirB10 family protein [Rickettsia sp. TH2014]|uniref:TraB/VirB10 family protein n=1 Tax=Rickettsia sp. TH2014 TaxID=1967503 RepID=UPI001C45EEE7
MINLKEIFKNIRNKRTNLTSSDSESIENTSVSTYRRAQERRWLYVCLLILGVLGAVMKLQIGSTNQIKHEEKTEGEGRNIGTSYEAMDGNRIWQNHFEDKLRSSQHELQEKVENLMRDMRAKEEEERKHREQELQKMAEQLKFAQDELKSAALELKRVSDIAESNKYEQEAVIRGGEVSSIKLGSNVQWDKPKDIRDYIPETSFVSGYTLGGIVTSTGINTASENATPVVIRLSNRGNLPKNINVDISKCRIQGSSYGDLSSERVIIRAEKLICIDPKTELVTTSDVIGVVHGDDGMNGIKGKVIATSNRHIKNAFIGSMLSGLASSSKGVEGLTLTSLGAVNTKRQGFKDLAGQGLLSGGSNAGEKIADYYLRLAEQMSPVLTVPGGVKVDVIFTKGFFLGEVGMQQKIAKARKINKQVQAEEYDEY